MNNKLNFKTILRIVGIISMVLVIGFSMVSCNEDDTTTGGGGGGGGGSALQANFAGNWVGNLNQAGGWGYIYDVPINVAVNGMTITITSTNTDISQEEITLTNVSGDNDNPDYYNVYIFGSDADFNSTIWYFERKTGEIELNLKIKGWGSFEGTKSN